MLGLIGIAVSLAASWFGYGIARRFVRERLRYVDAAHTPFAAIAAGVGAALVGAILVTPISWIPLLGGIFTKIVGTGTAIVFGIGTGLGARAGSSDVKRGYHITSGY